MTAKKIVRTAKAAPAAPTAKATAARAVAVAKLGNSAAKLREAIRAAIAAGDARKPFMLAVRAALKIDAAVSEKEARAGSDAFDSVVNAWNYCNRKAKGLTGPKKRKVRAGKEEAAPAAAPAAGEPLAKALAAWAGEMPPAAIAKVLADNMLVTKLRKVIAEMEKLAK